MTSFARNIGRTIINDTRTRGRVLSDDEALILLKLVLKEREFYNRDDKAEELHAEAMKTGIYNIMYNRIANTTNAKVSVPALLFLSDLSDGKPGNAVLFAAVIAELSADGTRDVILDDVVEAFPFKVPSEEVMHSAWNEQKGKMHDGEYYDNALDGTWAWESSEDNGNANA